MLVGTKYREWMRSAETARRKTRDVHHAACERDPDNEPLQRAAWEAIVALDLVIGMLGAIVDDQRDPRGKRPAKSFEAPQR